MKTQSKTNSQIVGQFQDDPDDEIARMQSTQAVEHNVKDLIRDGAEFYFRDQADDNLAKQAQSAGVNNVVIRQKSRWARFLEQSVYCTDYPVELTTPEELMGEYFRRRTPPEYRAGFFQLLGLGVCSVISGEFSGWNGGMLQSGYFGFWIANLLSAIMYLGLAGSLAELSSTLPVFASNLGCWWKFCLRSCYCW